MQIESNFLLLLFKSVSSTEIFKEAELIYIYIDMKFKHRLLM